MRLEIAILVALIPIFLSGCLCCAIPPIDGNPTPTPAPLPTVSYSSTPVSCGGGSATFDITKNMGGAAQNVHPGVHLEVGESEEFEQVRIELIDVHAISSTQFATFRYYLDGEFQSTITGAAGQDDLHDLPGTTYGIRITNVTAGAC